MPMNFHNVSICWPDSFGRKHNEGIFSRNFHFSIITIKLNKHSEWISRFNVDFMRSCSVLRGRKKPSPGRERPLYMRRNKFSSTLMRFSSTLSLQLPNSRGPAYSPPKNALHNFRIWFGCFTILIVRDCLHIKRDLNKIIDSKLIRLSCVNGAYIYIQKWKLISPSRCGVTEIKVQSEIKRRRRRKIPVRIAVLARLPNFYSALHYPTRGGEKM